MQFKNSEDMTSRQTVQSPKNPINVMPESLDDMGLNKNDFIAPPPQHQANTPTEEIPKEVLENISPRRLDNFTIDQEIMHEKIAQDLKQSTKKATKENKPRDILKSIIAKGDYREDVEIEGYKWTLRALNQKELLMAMDDISDETHTETGRMTSLMFTQIVYAIEAIEGIPIYEWFTDMVDRSKYLSTEEYKLAVKRVLRRYIELFPPKVINDLNAAYLQVEEKRNEAMKELKN